MDTRAPVMRRSLRNDLIKSRPVMKNHFNAAISYRTIDIRILIRTKIMLQYPKAPCVGLDESGGGMVW